MYFGNNKPSGIYVKKEKKNENKGKLNNKSIDV